MSSLILRTASSFLLPLLLLFSVVVMLRGHNEPGGGFVGGLVAASAFLLHMLAHGPSATRRLLGIDPISIVGVGLALALGSGLLGVFFANGVFDAVWVGPKLIGGIKPGTPLIFDIGVYFTVLGVVLVMVLVLAEMADDAFGVGGRGDDVDRWVGGDR